MLRMIVFGFCFISIFLGILHLHATDEAKVLISLAAFCLLFMVLGKYKRNILAFLPMIVAFPPFFLGKYIGIAAYLGLFWVLHENQNRKQAVETGYYIGLSQICLLCWLFPALETPAFVFIALAIFFAVWWCLIALLIFELLKQHKLFCSLLATLVIPLADWLRASNGFLALPYNTTPHMVTDNIFLAQLVDWGYWELAILVCMVSLLGSWAVSLTHPKKLGGVALFCMMIAILHLVGYMQLSKMQKCETKTVAIGAVSKCTKSNLSSTVAALKHSAEIIVFPENFALLPYEGIYKDVLLQDMMDLANSQCDLLVGTLVEENEIDYRVAAFHVMQNKLRVTDKFIGAPIGEVHPFAKLPFGQGYEAINGRFVSKFPQCGFRIKDLYCSVCFCYEHMIPNIWEKRKINLDQLDIQICLAKMESFQYSALERMQSLQQRKLMAIMHRKPFLYVEEGASQWLSHCGELQKTSENIAVWQIKIPTSYAKTKQYLVSFVLLLFIAFLSIWEMLLFLKNR